MYIFLFLLLLIYSNSYSNKFYKLKNIILNIKNNNINSYYYKNKLKKKFNKYIYKNNIYNIKKFLYKLGHFNNIKFFFLKNKNILFLLKYKYIINNIFIFGNKLFNDYKILYFLNKFNINYGKFLNNYNILKFKIYLINKYKKIGKYNIKIDFFKINLNKNKCLLKLIIKEEDFLKVNKINILGNININKNIIFSLMKIKQSNIILDLLFNNNFYYNNFIKDLENIKYYYFNKGYLDFFIKKIKIKFYKKNILNIFIYLNEGKKYKIFNIIFKSDILKFNKILYLIKKKFLIKNNFYEYNKIKKIIYYINFFFKNKGYANLNIKIKYKKIKNNNIIFFININFNIKYYINKILFKGNKKNNFNFLIKKIPIFKNELYNIFLIKKGILNLKNTNLFSLIKYKEKFININSSNKINIIYKVIENDNNIFNFNMGYGRKSYINYDFVFSKKNIFINDSNFLIKNLRNKFGKFGNIFFYYPINNNIYLKHKFLFDNILYDNLNDYGYLNFSYGIENSIIFLISNYLKYKLSLNYTYNYLYNIKSQLSSLEYFNSINKKYNLNSLNNNLHINDFFLINNLSLNKLDNNIFPNSGYYIDIYNKYTLFSLNNNYYKIYFSFSNYIPLNKYKNLIFYLYSNIGYVSNLNKKKIPFYEYFYSGNNNNFLRGFNYENIGFNKIFINSKNYKCKKNKKICFSNNFYGGNLILSNNLNIIIPNYYFLNNYYSKYIRISFFLDTGLILNTNWKNIFKNFNNNIFYNYKNMIRLSIGTSFNVITPIGMLNLSFGIPIKYNNNNEINYFQFSIGNNI